MNFCINSAPCYKHGQGWNKPAPTIEGPIELYDPTESETEDLPPDANFDCEFRGEYETLQDAIDDIVGETGRFMMSRPNDGNYIGFLNHCYGSVAVVIY